MNKRVDFVIEGMGKEAFPVNMNEQSILQQMEHWGYYLLPKSHPESPGYTGLLVAIRETPTGEHFDPESIHLRIIEDNKETDWDTFRLKLLFLKSRHTGPGQVSLRDRTGKRANFFTFGGFLEATSIPGETVYSVRSPAPILDLNESSESVAEQLAFESEALIAEQKARWGSNERGFSQRLAEITPLEFYLAVLHSILQRYEENSALLLSFQQLYEALLGEKEWLVKKDQWPVLLHNLNQLFDPDRI
jgi:hypothetical protein